MTRPPQARTRASRRLGRERSARGRPAGGRGQEEQRRLAEAAHLRAGAPSTRILGKTTRDAVRNKKGWKRRRAPTQDPSTDLAARGMRHEARERRPQTAPSVQSEELAAGCWTGWRLGGGRGSISLTESGRIAGTSPHELPRFHCPRRQSAHASGAWGHENTRGRLFCSCRNH